MSLQQLNQDRRDRRFAHFRRGPPLELPALPGPAIIGPPDSRTGLGAGKQQSTPPSTIRAELTIRQAKRNCFRWTQTRVVEATEESDQVVAPSPNLSHGDQ
jgi:hypothetical protein